ncbi:ATPase domain-containing protein [Oceanobacillus piezotolerans]|uniref:ATPase domain-containing protein n=1 Tax=Oceanobacillus piezotolerans TaxID=2448030 RepID=UPI001FE9DAFA|nr:ATPase domain-containing protein [Oceanobacillus piezotolerans]
MQTATGITGLDNILGGGLPKGSAVIVEGAPGTGKTTLGMQFLYNGITEQNEAGIFITFEEFPDQIYHDMKSFGWDLRALERKNQLRVIGISPKILLEEMQKSNGLFEQMVNEINCERLVIDSISLLRTGDSEKTIREVLYTLRNILRKFKLTSLLIQERSDLDGNSVPFEHYIFDGLIRLSLKEHLELFRQRTLEVLKMRGTCIMEGEHIYRITENGIYVLLASKTAADIQESTSDFQLKTGIPSLDAILGGGLDKGTIYMLDTNSKANYRHIVASILAQRINSGDRILSLLSSIQSIEELASLLEKHKADVGKGIEENRMYFIEHYKRSIPEKWQDAVYHVHTLDNKSYNLFLKNEIYPKMNSDLNKHKNWFIYYDLNAIINERGTEYVLRHFATETAAARSLGMSVLVLCNFKEVGIQVASFLERSCNGVLKTWVDGSYQYLQITKASNGEISKPYLVENINDCPYIRLL